MANMLTVAALRGQLQKRGLDTDGRKATLVDRLNAAIAEEAKQSANVKKDDEKADKRKRSSYSSPDEEENKDAKQSANVTKVDKRKRSSDSAPDEEENKDAKQSANVTKVDKRKRSSDSAPDEEENKDAKQSANVTKVDKRKRSSDSAPDEEKNKDAKQSANVTKVDKRKRSSDSAPDEEKNKDVKRIKVEDIIWSSVKELKDALSTRGLSKRGNRAELVERLTEALKNDKADPTADKDADTSVKDDKGSKVVVGLKKGHAVLDQYLDDNMKQICHVYEANVNNNVEAYDAMLNQTNLGQNNNKFYVIQVLESDASKARSYYCFSRWGRVGVRGQVGLQGPFVDAESAVDQFKTKFYSKTKNNWDDRQNFVAHPKCYTWIEMDYEEKSTDQDGKQEKSESKKPVEVKPSKLEPRVKQFIDLICDIKMMNQMMTEIGYDARKMPLGKLSKSTISKGYEVLKRLSEVLTDKPNSSSSKQKELIQELTSEFYTVIPHDFGFKHMSQFIIDTPQKLKAKLQMVEALGEIELATKLLSNDIPEDDDPAYTHYKRLHCEFEPLDTTSAEYELVKQYTEKTHGETHSNYTLELLNVFKLQRDGESERFKPFEKNPNRMLLWHGSRLSNWTGILSQGLRIAPPEAPVTGYMFGKGVYFADMVSKSANYCCTHAGDPAGVLLLSEVALGDMRELYNGDCNANNLPKGKLSTKGVGRMIPDPKDYKTLEDGVVVPVGKPVQNDKDSGNYRTLMYNEYIVYNPAQIRMRYLLQVRFNYNSGRWH